MQAHKPRICVWADQFDHKRKTALSITLQEASGAERLVALTVGTEDVSGRLISGTDDQTIPAYGPRAAQIDGREFLQAMLDCAWLMGLRPAGYSDHPEHVGALKYHLEDMRRLVFAEVRETLAHATTFDPTKRG